MFANYTSCCRLCLADDKVASLNSIYAGYPDADTLVQIINALIGVQVTAQDKLTTMLCDKCYNNVNSWDGFKKKCLENQEKLQEWMNNATEAPVVLIKEEPIDVDDHDDSAMPIEETQEEAPVVKSEPADVADPLEDYPELPPALSPCPPALTREDLEENTNGEGAPKVASNLSTDPPKITPKEFTDTSIPNGFIKISKTARSSISNVARKERQNPLKILSNDLLSISRTSDGPKMPLSETLRKALRKYAGMPELSPEATQTVPKTAVVMPRISKVTSEVKMPEIVDFEIKKIEKDHPVCGSVSSSIQNRKVREKSTRGICAGQGGGIKRKFVQTEEIVLPESENSQESQKTRSSVVSSNISEIEQEKITFAAGLRLQSKSATPTPTPTSAQNNQKPTDLSKIEWDYVERNRVMVTMFKRMKCCCHNQHFNTWKKLITHLRSLYVWFTPFTCYNCLVVFSGRSGMMKHYLRCAKSQYEQLLRLTETKTRTPDKIRLYQNYKCLQCNIMFYFFEDLCEHVDNEHVEDVAEGVHTCLCEKAFENKLDFAKHIYKSCYVNSYCDICCKTYSDVDEFRSHCEETHDNDANFEFLPLHPNFAVFNQMQLNQLIGNKLKPPALRASTKEDSKGDDDIKVINPLALTTNFVCKVCKQECSSYHNLQKHLKTFHKEELNEAVDRGVCDICGSKFSSYHNMLRHRRVHDDDMKQLQCPECPEKFRLNMELKDHLSSIHSSGRPVRMIHRCSECGEAFKNIPMLEEHKKTHLHKCEECGKAFNTIKEYEQHRSSHLTLTLKRDPHTLNYSSLSPGNKMCQLCERQFETEEELQEHMTLHETMPTLEAENESMLLDKPRNYNCEECFKFYNNPKSLWAHNRRFHPGRSTVSSNEFPKACNECGRVIGAHPAWIMHQQMHKRNSLKAQKINSDNSAEDSDYHTCKRCFKVFGSRSNLKNHMKSHGINVSPSRALTKTKQQKTYWCDSCHTACHGLAELNKHKSECNVSEVDSESKFDTGDEGGKKPRKNFEQPVDPQEELNRKPVYCKYCKIPFTSLSTLNQHMAKEHDERAKPSVMKQIKPPASSNRYSCTVCKKSFATAGALNTHQGWHKRSKTSKLQIKQEYNVNNGEAAAEHRCKTCGLVFDEDTTLQLHILEIHRNINTSVLTAPKCKYCSLEFKSRADCDHHEKTFHAPSIPDNKIGVSCKYCYKVFSRSDYLNLHINKKHPQYATAGPYKCTQCNRVFDKQNALSIHLKVHERLNTTAGPVKNGPASAGQQNPNRVYKYSCSICHTGYDLPKDLRNHIITSHPF